MNVLNFELYIKRSDFKINYLKSQKNILKNVKKYVWIKISKI